MYTQKTTLFSVILLIFVILSSCVPQESRFTVIVPSATPTVAVVKGQVTLLSNCDPGHEHGFTREGLVNPNNIGAFFDFDKREITATESADIYLNVSCGTDCFNSLIEINSAKAARFGEMEPGYDECRKVLLDGNRLPASAVPGKYSCLQTNNGNIVQIFVIKSEALSRNANITLEYTIWYLKNP